jgi:hypothetical protein
MTLYFSMLKKHLPPQLSFDMLCVGKIPAPPIYWLGENQDHFASQFFRPANPLLLSRYINKFLQGIFVSHRYLYGEVVVVVGILRICIFPAKTTCRIGCAALSLCLTYI